MNKKKQCLKWATLFLFLCLCSGVLKAQIILNVEVENIRSSEGVLSISLYDNEVNYENNKPFKNKTVSKEHAKEGVFLVQFQDVFPGTYGIAVLDDENTDHKMNYTLMGFPKEGYGFSNFYHRGFTKPKFSDFVFELINHANDTVNVTLRYLK